MIIDRATACPPHPLVAKILSKVHTTDSPRDPRKRIEKTLVHAGPSVTVTSIAVASCFFVASAVSWSHHRSFTSMIIAWLFIFCVCTRLLKDRVILPTHLGGFCSAFGFSLIVIIPSGCPGK